MQVYDIEKLAVAARAVADKCASLGFPNAPAQLLPLRKTKDGKYEGAFISRLPDIAPGASEELKLQWGGGQSMIAMGWIQESMAFEFPKLSE